MTTRREFLTTVGGAAGLSALWANHATALAANQLSVRPFSAQPTPFTNTLLARQQDFVDLRLGLLANFNMSTFQDLEWADPLAKASVFAPTGLHPAQWATAAKSANMTWGCLSVKHHDGFCLWPTSTNSQSVQHAGAPDVVRAFVEAFREQNLKVGFQFSMLDQRQGIEHFSVTAEKIAIIKQQLRELLTNYGPITILIFEGWNTAWARISYDELPFDEIYWFIKSIQPDCLVCELNTARFPSYGLYYTDIKGYKASAGMSLPNVTGAPGCAIVSLNNSWWFWRQRDLNAEPLAAKAAVEQWLVPFTERQYTVLFAAPPGRDGLIAPNLVRRLAEIGQLWKHPGPAARLPSHHVITTRNLLRGRPIVASKTADAYGADFLNDGEIGYLWANRARTQPGWAEVDLGETKSFNTVAFSEIMGRAADYRTSRVASFAFKRWDGNTWVEVAGGKSPRAGVIMSIPRVSAQRIRFEVTNGPAEAWIGEIGVYDEPERA